ncbi:MAG: alpha/beta hydrolase [Patescibacteria group bacterium]
MSSIPRLNAIILHGTGNTSNDNWFQWLSKELEKMGMQVWCPNLPNTNKPNPKMVVPFILKHAPFKIDHNTLLIGHSSGSVQILHLLPHIKNPVKLALLIGSFKDNDFLKWDPNNELFSVPFDFDKCRNNCRKFTYIHSDNDPFCPLDHAKYLQSQTGGELVIVPDQKHFSISTMGAAYKEFPKLLEVIKKNI